MVSAMIPLLLAGLSGLGGAFGKQKQTSTTNSSTTPNYDPTQLAFRDYLMNQFKGSIEGLPTQQQYQTAGVKNIGNSFSNVLKSVGDQLTARGINQTSAGANSMADGTYRAGKSISDFLTDSPFKFAEFRQPFIQQAGGFSSAMPVGSSSTQTTTGTGGPTSPMAGFLSGASQGGATYLGQQSATNNFLNSLKAFNATLQLGQNGPTSFRINNPFNGRF